MADRNEAASALASHLTHLAFAGAHVDALHDLGLSYDDIVADAPALAASIGRLSNGG